MTTATAARTDVSLIAHLLRRAGFGATRDQINAYAAKGYEETVEELLRPKQEEAADQDLLDRYFIASVEARSVGHADPQWAWRLATSQKPLEEKIALFWHGLLAVGGVKLDHGLEMLTEIELFRRVGLGSFQNILIEISRNPGMMYWLDNQNSHKDAPNENYGREILELFSMGVGNYNEDDIKETARAFTGWSVVNPEYMSIKMRNNTVRPYGYISWQYQYDPEDHDDGEKTILGETGNWNGEDAVRIICEHKATAEYIARHLYHFYVADEVPVPQWPHESPRDPKAIQAMVDSYFQSEHSIKAMLETMFKSEFFKNQSVRYARIKSPAEMVVGTMRLAGPIQLPSDETYYAQAVCSNMGQALLGPPSVEGWQGGNEWINTGTYVERINFASKILDNPDKVGVRNIIDRIKVNVGTNVVTSDELVSACLEVLGPVDVSVMTENRLKEFATKYEKLGWQDEVSSKEFDKAALSVIQLIVCTQEYQTA